jgi:hypothetical protein
MGGVITLHLKKLYQFSGSGRVGPIHTGAIPVASI